MNEIVLNGQLIICDTNIWYCLSDGRIDPKDVAGKQLIGTFINGVELTATKNLYSDFRQVCEAIKAFDKYASGCLAGSPVEHVSMMSGRKPVRSQWEEIEVFMNAMVMSSIPPDPDEAKRLVTTYLNAFREENQPFNDLLVEHREQITSRGLRGVHKKKLSDPQIRSQNKEWLKNYLNATAFEGIVVDWTLFDLFLSTFDEWLRQLSIQDSLLLNSNDWNDLLNLVYVAPGDLYWTEDYKKTTKLINSIGYSHYLYQHKQNNNG